MTNAAAIHMADDVVRETFSTFPTGVVALAAEVSGQVEVMICSSFSVGISLKPPLVTLAVRNDSKTWPRLATAKFLGVSVLSVTQHQHIRQMAMSAPEDRLAGIPSIRSSNGAVVLDEAATSMTCTVWNTVPAGDHLVVMLEVLDRIISGEEALVTYRSAICRPDPLENPK